MEDMTYQGNVEVILQDKDGNIKHHEKHKNNITRAYLNYILYDNVNHGGFSGISNIHIGNNIMHRSVPSSHGIYAMDKTINITDNIFMPPYVGRSLTDLDPSVAFHGTGAGQENGNIMVPSYSRCYIDWDKKETVTEYVKNTGNATVKSVCIGGYHTVRDGLYRTDIRDMSIPAGIYQTSMTEYNLLEHTENSTIIHKTNGSSTIYTFDFNTKTTTTLGNASIRNTITNHYSGIKVGNLVFRALRKSSTIASTIFTLQIVTYNTSAVINRDITVPLHEGLTTNTWLTMNPIVVYRPDTHKIEIFVSLSYGEHGDDGYGIHVKKVLVNPNDPQGETEIEDLGVVPYGPGNFTTLSHYTHSTGLYHNGKYYLPIHCIEYPDMANLINICDNTNHYGAILSEDLKTIYDWYPVQNGVSGASFAQVITDRGIRTCNVINNNLPYVCSSRVVSGANLDIPVTKENEDMMRIIYRYRFA